MRVFIVDGAEDIAESLISASDVLMDVRKLISEEEVLPEDTESIIFTFSPERGNIPPALQYYLENIFKERDNSTLGYVAGISASGSCGLSLYILERLLYNAGCALPYSVSVKGKHTLENIRKDINEDEILVHGRIPLSHFISRFKLRANRRRYYG